MDVKQHSTAVIELRSCVKVEVDEVDESRWTSWARVPNRLTVSVDVKQHSTCCDRAQELCESRGGRPGLSP